MSAHGAQHPNWKGGRTLAGKYVRVYCPENPRARRNYVPEHILEVEKAMGKPLRRGAEVHHVNQDKQDNRHENLVACQDRTYHKLLHRRARALAECGNPSALRCEICQGYGNQENISVAGHTTYHRDCARLRRRRERLRAHR